MKPLTQMDAAQITRSSYDEEQNATRVYVVNSLETNSISCACGPNHKHESSIAAALQFPDIKLEPIKIVEYKEIQVPVIIKELEIKEIQVPVIIKELEIKEIEKQTSVFIDKIPMWVQGLLLGQLVLISILLIKLVFIK